MGEGDFRMEWFITLTNRRGPERARRDELVWFRRSYHKVLAHIPLQHQSLARFVAAEHKRKANATLIILTNRSDFLPAAAAPPAHRTDSYPRQTRPQVPSAPAPAAPRSRLAAAAAAPP